MDTLYHQTNKLIQEIQNTMGQVERANTVNEFQMIQNTIQEQLNTVFANCERLDILVSKELPGRRDNARMRVNQLKYDGQHLQAALRGISQRKQAQQREELERKALLSRSFAPNDDTSISMDPELTHHSKLTDANRQLDNYIDSGSTILGNLRQQRFTLKGAQKKILDVANTLGLSNTVLRLIERRSSQDKYILFGGMILTLVIMFLIYMYLTS